MTTFPSFNSLDLLRGEVGRLLDDYLSPYHRPSLYGALRRGAFPALNVSEDADHYYVEAELPGFKMSDLELLLTGRDLSIKGKRHEESLKDAVYHRQERGTGEFSRMLEFPTEVDAEKVEATLQNGVLEVRLAKSAAAKPKKIEVKG